MFALGLLSWLYNRPTEGTTRFLSTKFASKPEIARGQPRGVPGRLELRRDDRGLRRLLRGRARADAARHLPQHHRQHRARLRPGRRRAPRRAAAVPRLVPDHPGLRHPAQLAELKRFGVRTIQAEDEIAGIGAALGAAFGGAIGVTTTSGPGRRAEERDDRAGGVASSCRWSSSTSSAAARRTGLPTKTEQADLLQAMFGRNGEAPVADRGAALPGRLLRRRDRGGPDRDDLPHAGAPALRRLPGQRLRAVAGPRRRELPDLRGRVRHRRRTRRRRAAASARTCATRETLARPWAVPGTPGLEHRIGGIEKADVTGNISYDPDNHDQMVRLRQAKVDGIAARRRRWRSTTRAARPSVLVLGWGSTYGPIAAAAARRAQRRRAGRARRTCATSTRSRPTPARCCGATSGCSCPR